MCLNSTPTKTVDSKCVLFYASKFVGVCHTAYIHPSFPIIPLSFSLIYDFHNCHIYVLSRKCHRTISIYPLLNYLEDNFVLRLKTKTNKQQRKTNKLSWVEWAYVSWEEDLGKPQLFLWHKKSSISLLLPGSIEITATSHPS